MATWPKAPAQSSNNWVDHFSGSALDSAKWGTILSGSATAVVADSTVQLNSVSAGQASAIYSKIQPDPTKRQMWMFCVDREAGDGGWDFVVSLITSVSAPAPDSKANFDGYTVLRTQFADQTGGPSVMFRKWDNVGGNQFWIPDTGWGSYVGTQFQPTQDSDYYIIGFEVDGPNNQWRALAWGQAFTSPGTYTSNQGLKLFGMTDWVPWSSSKASSNLWLVIGNPTNNDSVTTSWNMEWAYYAEAPGNVWYQAFAASKSLLSQGHAIRSYHSCDGFIFVPDTRTGLAIPLGASGTYDGGEAQEPHFHWDGQAGGTDHIWYMSSNNSTGVQSISHATASHAVPQLGTWTKDASNPVLQISPTGTAQDDQQLSEPFVVYDQTAGKWYMFYSAQSSVDNKWRTFLAAATSPNGPWTKQGLVLDVGSTGAIDEKWARRPSLVYYNGLWYMFYEAKDSSSVDHMAYATATSLNGPWTKVTTSLMDPAAGGNTSLTSALNSAPGRSWSVVDSAGLNQDSVVVISDSTNMDTFGLTKVRKKISSVLVEVYHGLTGFTTSPTSYIVATASSLTWNVQQVWLYGSSIWVFWLVPWEPFSATAESASVAALYEGCHVSTHASPSPVGATPVYQDFYNPGIPHDVWAGMESVENMTMLYYPVVTSQTFTQSLTGTLASAGSPLLVLQKLVSGTISIPGFLTKNQSKTLVGSSSPTGSRASQFQRLLAGTISIPGSAVKGLSRLLSGAVSISGAESGTRVKILGFTAVIPSSGSAARLVEIVRSGVVNPVSAAVRSTTRSLGGSISSAGSSATTRVRLLLLSGSMALSSSASRFTSRLFSGSASLGGSTTKLVSRVFDGLVAGAGNLLTGSSNLFTLAFSSSLSAAGSVTTAIQSLVRLGGKVFKSMGRGITVFRSRRP